MTTNAELAFRVGQIRSIARSFRIPDVIRFVLAAPRMVHELLEKVDRDTAYYEDQIRRRDQDLHEIRGRRSVEIEAAAREGFRQGCLSPEILEPGQEDPPFNLGLVYAAALEAKPTEVTAELTMVGRSRHG